MRDQAATIMARDRPPNAGLTRHLLTGRPGPGPCSRREMGPDDQGPRGLTGGVGTSGRGGKVHPSFAESGAMPTRTTTTRGRRKQTSIHEASGSRPGMVHPMHRAGPRARTPRTLLASGSTNHLPAESRRKPDRSTASNMQDTRLPPGARRGKAPPWDGDGRRRLGEGEGRSWQPPCGHGPGWDAQVLLLADAAREST